MVMKSVLTQSVGRRGKDISSESVHQTQRFRLKMIDFNGMSTHLG